MLTRTPQRKRERGNGTGPRYKLENDGSYRIDHYDTSPAFCSFLPGLAGPNGVPLWCLYVNRAQAVVSFGVQDKNHAIAEYLPATWAYQLVGLQGFRTFCKIDGEFYEPFRPVPADDPDCLRSMHIQMHALELTENAPRHGLAFRVSYFTPVNEPLGALVRNLTITNVGPKRRRLSLLDGLPLILPAGFTDPGLKAMRHIHEAYAHVRLACGHVPCFTAKVAAHDEAEVVPITGGNFYAAWFRQHGDLQPVEPFVDPHVVFGGGQDFVTPRHFIARDGLDRTAQVWENRLPCALVPAQVVLDPGETVELIALAGHAPDERMLAAFLAHFSRRADFERAALHNLRLVDSVVAPALSVSGVPPLDAYVRQNFLDNVLRGGVPTLWPSRSGPTLLPLYARRHGDLERDYNHFVLPAHPLSSGAGNYRDVCQNRRCDVWFQPEVGEHEIKLFVGLLQADGYNPLSVDGYRWRLAPDADPLPLCPPCDEEARAAFARLLHAGFQPGELLQWAALHAVSLADHTVWLNGILAQCERTLAAHGHDGGYWIDHWTYITDLLEAYAGVYPDQVEAMLTGAADVGWFDEGAFVAPRRDKYARRAAGPLQLHAVRAGQPTAQPLPPVTVFGKLCALLAIKAVSFDYEGRGIEMEAGRPGWNDSLNGLPGLFGSSTCEAAEVARLAGWLRASLPRMPDTTLPVEVADFLSEVIADLSAPDYSWDRAATLREQFRARLHAGVSGQSRTVSGAQLELLLAGVERRARTAVEKSVNPATGLLHTYYANRPLESAGETIMKFTPQPLPLYLEGQVHWLRLLPEQPDQARAIYQAVRASPLFDAALQMYKLNECLDACSPEIGRARTFTRGWFENESVWTHMSYKYLLELLRAGLYDEFFADAQSMLVPSMDPAVYGRSILENSSFIASSANPDPHTRGRGFIARLSGSTAEFIHMWLLLTVGPRPFFLEDGRLHFRVRPALPGGWFTPQDVRVRWQDQNLEIPAGCFASAQLGSLLLVYHNPSRRDTFGRAAVRPVRYVFDQTQPIDAPAVGEDVALRVRQRAYHRLDVHLA